MSKLDTRAPIVIETLAGGLYHVAHARTLRGEVRQLPTLVPELTQIVLGTYLGVEAGVATAVAPTGGASGAS